MTNRWTAFSGALLACLTASSMARAAPGAETDELLFLSNRSGNVFELYRMNASGQRVQRVLPERGEAGEMSWSPDGRKVLYSKALAGQMLNIFVTDLATGVTTQLTRDDLPSTSPVWSPDGGTIAFVSSRGGARKVYLMDADGGRQRRLTDSVGNDEIAPRFSPRGDKVAYLASNLETLPKVAVADLKAGTSGIVSTNKERVIETPPQWSPDGARLLFSQIKSTTAQLFSMAADGSARKALSSADGRHGQAQWSSDGKRILFISIPAGSARQQLQVMNADGSGLQVLRSAGNDMLDARWSADDGQVFFVEQLPAGGKIFSLEMSSGAIRRLSGDEGFDVGIQVFGQSQPDRVARAK